MGGITKICLEVKHHSFTAPPWPAPSAILGVPVNAHRCLSKLFKCSLTWSSFTKVMSSLLQTCTQVSAVWRLGFLMANLPSKDGDKRRSQTFQHPLSPGLHPSLQHGHLFPNLHFAAVHCIVAPHIPHQIQLWENSGFPNLSCISRWHLYLAPRSFDPAFFSCMLHFYDWVRSSLFVLYRFY